MLTAVSQLVADHAPAAVLSAVVICFVGSWLLVGLIRQARETGEGNRIWWLCATAAVAGVMVWTTHFLAMLGYRADLALEYDLGRTVLSVAMGVACVGGPLVAAALQTHRWARAVCGALAGLGIGAMHFTGMSALQGCLQSQSLLAAALGCLAGAASYATALALAGRFHTRLVKTALFTGGVAATHFIAISGVTLEALPGAVTGPHMNLLLGVFTVLAAVVLFSGAFISLVTSNRFRLQEQAHTAILGTALDNMSNGLVFLGRDERVHLFNDRFMQLFGLPAGSLRRGMALADALDVMARANGWDATMRSRLGGRMHKRLRLGEPETAEHVFDDGRIIEIVSGPVKGGIVMTFDDRTTERNAQRRVAHMAYHDALTGLANRRALHERIEGGLAARQAFTLLIVDLDRFKAVNDTYGHKVGDQLLVEVAGQLRAAVGKEGFVARLGGDEMAVLVEGDAAQARPVADEIIQVLSRPIFLAEHVVSIGCSIGMCGTADAQGMTELMHRADLALYEAKRQGRGQARCYRPGMLEEVTERRQLETDLHQAIAEGQFHLVYQPVWSLNASTIVGYEALIRWDHPTRGIIPPATFIPLAEETGQIAAIGKWVLEEACREAASWPNDCHVAVNISPAQFHSPQLQAHVVGALDRSGLPAHRLEIELTETAMVTDGQRIAHVLADLRTLGVKVAMDDFGTGYSSFAHLKDFPLDRIKIDRSFVATATTDRHAMAVLKAITQLGRDMDVPTLAEGVETQAQLDLLRSLGCDDIQGYLIGRPARLDDGSSEHRRFA